MKAMAFVNDEQGRFYLVTDIEGPDVGSSDGSLSPLFSLLGAERGTEHQASAYQDAVSWMRGFLIEHPDVIDKATLQRLGLARLRPTDVMDVERGAGGAIERCVKSALVQD